MTGPEASRLGLHARPFCRARSAKQSEIKGRNQQHEESPRITNRAVSDKKSAPGLELAISRRGASPDCHNCRGFMRPGGFELPTRGLEVRRFGTKSPLSIVEVTAR